MKYGWRERISGAVILLALAAALLPWLFSEPAPRSERPQPMMTIEQPVAVPLTAAPDSEALATEGEEIVEHAALEALAPREAPDAAPDTMPDTTAESDPVAAPDPIAELALGAGQRLAAESRQESRQGHQSHQESASESASASPVPTTAASGGEWAVQVGSFGESANAERLLARLQEQDFPAYTLPRDNNLTTVYVGPFDSSEAGERAMQALKSRANLQGLLVRARH